MIARAFFGGASTIGSPSAAMAGAEGTLRSDGVAPLPMGYFSRSGSRARRTSETVWNRSIGSRIIIRLTTSMMSRGHPGARVWSGTTEV